MDSIVAWLSGKKTYLVALGSLLLIFGGYLKNQTPIDWNMVMEAILAMTIRAGITKS